MRRPLVWVACALVGGAGFASLFHPPFLSLLSAFLATWSFAIFFIILDRRIPAAVFVLIASFLLGTCSYSLNSHLSELPDALAQHYATDIPLRAKLRGTVIESQPAADRGRLTFVLEVQEIEIGRSCTPITGRVQANWYGGEKALEAGDVVEVNGKLKRLRGFKNPHTFDYERYMHRRGIFTRIFAQGSGAVVVRDKGRLGWLKQSREHFRRKGLHIISSSMRTTETRSFMSAVLLGERSLLTDKMEDWFRETGTFHVLAISGLHVGLVYLIVSLALTPVPFGSRSRVVISILAVWLYAFATGAGVSVTRASIMLTLVLSGYYLNREGDFLTSIALSALLIVGWNPLLVDEIGFQLSFTAVVLLCTFEPIFSDRIYPAVQARLHRIPAPVLHRLAVTAYASLVIGIGMLPLVAYHFNYVSLVFPIANIIVIPLLSLALAAGFACMLAGFIWLKAALVFGYITELFAWPIFTTVKFCSWIPSSSVRIVSPPLWALVLEALAIVLLWWRGNAFRKSAVFAIVAVLTVVISVTRTHLSGTPLRATFLDVGNADSCFLEFPGGENLLVDAGFATPGLDCGERLIAPFLSKKRIAKIDSLVLTHPDSDHIGGSLFLMQNFKVGQIIIAALDEDAAEFSSITSLAERKGCKINRVSAGDSFRIRNDVRIQVLNPPAETSRARSSDNDTSVVLRIIHGETRFLLGGDAEKKAIRLMVESDKPLHSQVLKAPHHGLASGFDESFAKRVGPEVAVVSGRDYQKSERVASRLSRYAAVCDTAMATSECGAIVIESDGKTVRATPTRRFCTTLF